MSKLSKEERLARVLRNKMQSSYSWDDIDQEMSRQITYVEKNLGFMIDKDYPLMKFLMQFDDLRYFDEQERKSMEKAKHGRS